MGESSDKGPSGKKRSQDRETFQDGRYSNLGKLRRGSRDIMLRGIRDRGSIKLGPLKVGES